MELTIHLDNKIYKIDHLKPINLSIPLDQNYPQVNCFFAPLFQITPVKTTNFIGSTALGGNVNFMNIQLNPHGNGTHTECVGHISTEKFQLNQSLKTYLYHAQLISIYPELTEKGDRIIQKHHLENLWEYKNEETLIIRTLPHDHTKLTRSYSGTNPPFFSDEAIYYLKSKGIKHLVTDLPSVDKEEDGGKLSAHKAFWNYPSNEILIHDTITELVYVPSTVKDGNYLCEFHVLNINLDVSPSQIILYDLIE